MTETEVTPTIEAALTQEFKLFLCHNCSDLKLVSGESCFFAVFHPYKKEQILHGACPCIMGKPCESDFYLLEGKAARERYAEMQENPLWFINGKAMRMSDEEIKKREEDEDKIIRLRCDARARRDIKARLEAFDYITLAKPCTLETDPLKAGWRA